MARFLYGVCGEGSGHAVRSREVINHLTEQGHQVFVVSSGRGLLALRQFYPTEEIFGLRFNFQENEIQYLRTLFGNLQHWPRAAKSIAKVTRLVTRHKIKMIFTDFEFISSYVANAMRLPVVSIDNQHLLTRAKVSFPRKYQKERAAAKFFTRSMTPRPKAYLITTFDDKIKPKKPRTFLFPPILKKEVLAMVPSDGESVLVYCSSQSRRIIEFLKMIPQNFICYGLDQEGQEGNLIFKKTCYAEFLKDLAAARAVIGNAGFCLISEALYLGKPYLAWPVTKQFEQVLNGYYLDQSGYGQSWEQLNQHKIEAFLDNLETYKERLIAYPRGDNSELLSKVDALLEKYSA